MAPDGEDPAARAFVAPAIAQPVAVRSRPDAVFKKDPAEKARPHHVYLNEGKA